jgi:hypothetical protein
MQLFIFDVEKRFVAVVAVVVRYKLGRSRLRAYLNGSGVGCNGLGSRHPGDPYVIYRSPMEAEVYDVHI